jgi:hypothetical protein
VTAAERQELRRRIDAAKRADLRRRDLDVITARDDARRPGPAARYCAATTTSCSNRGAGQPCGYRALEDSDYCGVHERHLNEAVAA